MKMKDIASNLCYYDKRNPDNNLDIMDLDDNEIEVAKKDCHCDNCFYGRTKLAEYIIKLKGQLNSTIVISVSD